MRYPQIAARAFNTPLLIAPKKFDAIMAFLAPRFGLGGGSPAPAIWYDDSNDAPSEPPPPYCVTESGVAIIPVHGTLVHRGSFMDDTSGLTSYTALSGKLALALADDNVSHIALDLDTPGGEVCGAFDFADEIYAARGRKPITALVNEMACSAGYLIASAADKIIATRTSYCGSIGVITSRLDISKANEREGVVVTMVYAGERKIDGYPFEPITPAERDALTRDIQRLYGLFVSTVARNRNLSEEAVRRTEADIFDGATSVGLGLADDVQPHKQALAGIEAAAPASSISVAARKPRASRLEHQRAALTKRS